MYAGGRGADGGTAKAAAGAVTIGIDYSGAETPTASLKGLRVYLAEGDAPPVEVPPPPARANTGPASGIAEWLVERLAEDAPTLVGIDHGFSFPLRYFEVHRLKPDWPAFLDDFQRHWPTDEDHTYVDFVRDGVDGQRRGAHGQCPLAAADRGTRRQREIGVSFRRAGIGGEIHPCRIPWLRFIRQRLGARVHFWPFDGWDIPAGRSAIAEVYPALWTPRLRQRGPHAATSMTPSASPPGFRAPTATAASRLSSSPTFRRPSARWRRWRAGYWAFPA